MIRRLARLWLRRYGVDVREPGSPHAITPASPHAAGVDPSVLRASSGYVVGAASPSRGAREASPTPWFTGLTEQDLAALPDAPFYVPLFSPWLGLGDFPEYAALTRPYSLVSDDRLYVLLTLARQALHVDGEWAECGVYKGGTAMLLARLLVTTGARTRLHLFDTFEGMPPTDGAIDRHQAGDYADTSLAAVEGRVRAIVDGGAVQLRMHAGWMPETFADDPPATLAFAHVDVDIHRSVRDCCEFVYPRLVAGGVLVFDDYGFPTCPGARAAVDAFFADKPERPLVLHTGQAIVHKLPRA